MIDFGSDTFLDMINLLIQEEYPKPLNRILVVDICSKLVNNFNEIIRIDTVLDNDENRYFLELIQDLINKSLSLEDKSQLNIFATKYLKKFPKSEEPAIKRILSSTLLGEESMTDTYKLHLFKSLKLILTWCISDREIKSISYKMKKITNTTDLLTRETIFSDIFQQGKNLISEVTIIGKPLDDEVNVSFINMSDKESIKKALESYRLTRASTIFKTGLQGLNDMLGEINGFTLGETVLFGALSHNYKSGILMDAARWVVSYTEAPKFDSKQPVILFISLENEAHKNLINWYKRSYTLINGHYPPKDLSDDAIADIVTKAYSINGWEFHVIREQAGFFGFEDYVEKIEEYKKNNYRVYATITDYIGLMRLGHKNTVIDSPSMKAAALQETMRKFANHSKHENILDIHAHQLSPEAGGIAASGTIYPVKKFKGASHFADCKSVYKEVDTCILMHIENNSNEIPFLTIHWSKHRDNIAPVLSKQFTAYPFTNVGILDDIMLPTSQAVTDIYNYRKDNDDTVDDDSIFN